MSAHGSLVGSLLLTMVICLPLTDTWLSSMTLHTQTAIENLHERIAHENGTGCQSQGADPLKSSGLHLQHKRVSASMPTSDTARQTAMDSYWRKNQSSLWHDTAGNGLTARGSLLDVSVEGAQGGVVLEQVRCLLDTACADRSLPSAHCALMHYYKDDYYLDIVRQCQHLEALIHVFNKLGQLRLLIYYVKEWLTGIVDDNDVEVAVGAALHTSQEVATCKKTPL